MGANFPIGESAALAGGILSALDHPEELLQANTDFSAYAPDSVAAIYEALFAEIRTEIPR
jgi:hypothetical protein